LWLGGSKTFAQSTPADSESVSGNIPTQAEQDGMLAAMRQYAGRYISHLPNFICVQVTQQFQAGRKAGHWRKGDTLRFKLIFFGGTEDRSIERVNDKPPSPRKPWRTPLSTEGEFGTLLGTVFGRESAAWFTWHGWDSVAGRKVAVFDFMVDREHSTMKLSLSDLAHAIVPYRGSVYADPLSGEIWQISNGPFDIPREVRTKSLATTIEYDEVQISGTRYLLPVKATVLLDTGSETIRNEIVFREYRKFEIDSSVTFASDGSTPDPNQPKPPK
jgi:hypothetical protein